MRTDRLSRGFYERGMIVLALTLLLLSAVMIFTQATSERFIRLQQRQSTHQAITTAYNKAHNTLHQILAIIRTTPIAQLTEALTLAKTHVVAHALATSDGREITTFQLSFEESVMPGVPARTFYAEAVRYSALLQRPAASFFSSHRLSSDSRLVIWRKPGQPGIAARTHQTMPADHLLECRQNRLPACTPYPEDERLPVTNNIVTQLFNRPLDSVSADLFIGSILTQHCENLTPDKARVIWVSGNCQLAVNQHMGTADEPVLLIIENGDLRLASGAAITGLVLLIRRNSALPSAIQMAANAFVTGAIINTGPLDNASHIQLIADTDTLIRLQRADALAKITLVPGSWRDYD